MGVFPDRGSNEATQFWIAFRFVFSVSFLLSTFYIRTKVRPGKAFALYGLVFCVLAAAVFLRWFPRCYSEALGLTPFKIASEYVICLILLAALVLFIRKRSSFDPLVFRLMVLSLLFSIASEVSFTEYASVYGLANLLGHLFLLASVVLIYRAIVVTGVVEPSRILFRDLKLSEEAIRASETKYRLLFENMTNGFAYHRIVKEPVLDQLGVAHHHPRDDAGVMQLEVPQQTGQPIGGDGRTGADVEGAGQFVRKLRNTGFQFLVEVQDAFCIGHDDLARWRKGDLAVPPFEEPGVVVLLQLLDLKGDRRLGHEEVFGGTGEGAVLGNGVENLKTTVSHGTSNKANLFRIFDHSCRYRCRSSRRNRYCGWFTAMTPASRSGHFCSPWSLAPYLHVINPAFENDPALPRCRSVFTSSWWRSSSLRSPTMHS